MADSCRYPCFLRPSNTTDSPIVSKALHSNSTILHCITIIIRSPPSLLPPQQHTTIEYLADSSSPIRPQNLPPIHGLHIPLVIQQIPRSVDTPSTPT